MSNHPNRGKRPNAAASPTPAAIAARRAELGMSTRDAAAVIYGTAAAWERWESGERAMHAGLWELFNLKTSNQNFGKTSIQKNEPSIF